MARRSGGMILLPVILVALAGLILAVILRDGSDGLPATIVNSPAPAVPDEAVQGTVQITDADLRSGEVTIVNFWASWCPPCRAEHPNLLKLEAQGYRIAGINYRDQQELARAYLTEFDDPFFATGYDLNGKWADEWGVAVLPETFIVDGDGTVLYRFIGPLVGSAYEQQFLPELAKAIQ